MKTDISVYQDATIEQKLDYARSLAGAGELLPRSLWANERDEHGVTVYRPSAGKIMLIVETGLMLGIHPMAALRGIDVLDGTPSLKPALMSALIRDAGHTLRIRESGTLVGGDLTVTVVGIRSDDPDFLYEYSWTPHTAVAAGLATSYLEVQPGMWQLDTVHEHWRNYPARMCRWRALGDTASAGFEDVLMGLHFTPEELGAPVNAAGESIAALEPAKPSEDWAALISEAETEDAVLEVMERARGVGELTDKLRTSGFARSGVLATQEAS